MRTVLDECGVYQVCQLGGPYCFRNRRAIRGKACLHPIMACVSK